MTARHIALGGKVQLFRRDKSPYWQCSASVGGEQYRASTKAEGLAQAKDFAEDWYLTLKGKHRFGGGIARPKKKAGTLFRDAAQSFVERYALITGGERNERYVKSHGDRIRVHLNPFFGDLVVTEITPGLVDDYRAHRLKPVTKTRKGRDGEVIEFEARPARPTMHHEIVTLRQILKHANRQGWLPMLPDLSTPYRSSGKVVHRAWFSPKEYQQLYEATRERARNPRHNRGRWKAESERLHDYVLFMVNTGLRPDEAARIEFRDVEIVDDQDTGETILEIEVRGKRGVGFCKSMPGAVVPFERLAERNTPDGASGPKPTDKVFGTTPRELLNAVLEELDLKRDRDGQVRTAYSLRHTYISMRLMEGADIYQVAKNCRTSVEMIEKYYASHIKNMINAAQVNVRRTKTNKRAGTRSTTGRTPKSSRTQN